MESGESTKPPNFYNRAVAAVERIAIKSLVTGNFAWFVLLAISLFAISRLNSQDLKEVILKVLATYGWLGYPVAAITIFVSTRILRWRENFYQQEMTRVAGVRNQLMQSKLELPLQSSVDKKTEA